MPGTLLAIYHASPKIGSTCAKLLFEGITFLLMTIIVKKLNKQAAWVQTTCCVIVGTS